MELPIPEQKPQTVHIVKLGYFDGQILVFSTREKAQEAMARIHSMVPDGDDMRRFDEILTFTLDDDTSAPHQS